MPMRMVLKFKPLLLSPFSKSKSPPPLRIADVLLLQDMMKIASSTRKVAQDHPTAPTPGSLVLLLSRGDSPPTHPRRQSSLSHGEVIVDVEEEDGRDSHCGVPPYGLERKLHELLETR
ncbi:hypothetical protein F3Y22_tig00116997pilonHSYRG00085 [Hibiscus syriacus]|uniref:Uncharacterized protein n=1 Tax=Hibiscus syriacus TaxID=106335 RepID=A0A6A2X3X5_HIBSY|nr:hypothetical protein F3Y22_tig00116997pilonHSYRG00085 [Hibiscus syriacus]